MENVKYPFLENFSVLKHTTLNLNEAFIHKIQNSFYSTNQNYYIITSVKVRRHGSLWNSKCCSLRSKNQHTEFE